MIRALVLELSNKYFHKTLALKTSAIDLENGITHPSHYRQTVNFVTWTDFVGGSSHHSSNPVIIFNISINEEVSPKTTVFLKNMFLV